MRLVFILVFFGVVTLAQERKSIQFVTESKKTVSFSLGAGWQQGSEEIPQGAPISSADRELLKRSFIGLWIRGGINFSGLIEKPNGTCNAREAANSAVQLRLRTTTGARLVFSTVTEPGSGVADLRMQLAAPSGPDYQLRLERFVCNGSDLVHLNGSYVSRGSADLAKTSLEIALKTPFETLTISAPKK